MTVADLSPDALARLEAKLVADLEMVRRVRVLLEEHRPLLTAAPATVAAAPASAAAPVQAVTPPEQRKSSEEIYLDCLARMPEGVFTPQDFKRAVYKVTRNFPDAGRVKTFLNRMIRQGKAVIVEARTGRSGSLYRSTLPRPAPAETPPARPDSPAVSAESPPVGAA